jgi:hypothetical protein
MEPKTNQSLDIDQDSLDADQESLDEDEQTPLLAPPDPADDPPPDPQPPFPPKFVPEREVTPEYSDFWDDSQPPKPHK